MQVFQGLGHFGRRFFAVVAIGHAWNRMPEDLGRDVDGHVFSFEGGGGQVPERMETFAVAGDAAALAVTSKPFAVAMAKRAVDFAECRKEPGAEGTSVPSTNPRKSKWSSSTGWTGMTRFEDGVLNRLSPAR